MLPYRSFKGEQRGNVGLMFALSIIPLMFGAGAAVDYSRAATVKTQLQSAADAAALAGANSNDQSSSARTAAAKSFFSSENGGSYDPNLSSKPIVSISASGTDVSVEASASVRAVLLSVAGVSHIPVHVKAIAGRNANGPPICILALNPTASGAVTFSGNSSFKAKKCAVYSNSSSDSGITLGGNATIEASAFCSAGGVSDSVGVTPTPLKNCIPVADPFAGIEVNTGNMCNFTNVSVQPNVTATLSPGVYCGGLNIKGTVTLTSGLYVIRNGQLNINSQATVTGDGVTFYMKGNNAGFDISAGGNITLSAMTSGDYKGMVLVQDRNSNSGGNSSLNGNSGTIIKGAIYAPTQTVSINGSGSFGQSSDFMPLIADQIHITGSSVVESDLTAVETIDPIPRMPSTFLKA
jgi:hypothetical protein